MTASNGLGLTHVPQPLQTFVAKVAGRLGLARPKTQAGHWYRKNANLSKVGDVRTPACLLSQPKDVAKVTSSEDATILVTVNLSYV